MVENSRKGKITYISWYSFFLFFNSKIYVSWYFNCKPSGEDKKHLLMHCKIASQLWWTVLIVKKQWTMPETIKDAMSSWAYRRRGREVKHLVQHPIHFLWALKNFSLNNLAADSKFNLLTQIKLHNEAYIVRHYEWKLLIEFIFLPFLATASSYTQHRYEL